MLELINTIRRVADSNVTVLLTGETGVGKELFARALHQASARSDRVFLPFNCATVPREMFDSQLFGHKRGSFTGAIDDSPGVIRSAAGGTLLLDEIGEMSLDTQPKLLRFLESGEIRPLGDARPQLVDVRIVAATNANLEQLVADGRFREDLYYRLNVIRINIPPLRERREEIPALVEHFLEQYGREFQKPQLRLADETLEYLVLYRWPGNVRQLANEIRRMVALAEPGAVLMPAHLSDDIAASRRTIPTERPVLAVDRSDDPARSAARCRRRTHRARGHPARGRGRRRQPDRSRKDARPVAKRPLPQAPAPRPRVTAYSARSVTIGSTRVARYAGTSVAIDADREHQQRDRAEGAGIVLADAEQQRRHHPHQRGGEHQAQRHADQRRLQSFDHDHPEQPAHRRAERHADADLAHALAHGVGQHAVDADGREHQREQRKRRQQQHRQRPLPQRLLHDLVHRRDVEHRLLGIDGANRA